MNIENIQRMHDRPIEIWFTSQTGSLGSARDLCQPKAKSENIRIKRINLDCRSFFCEMVPLRLSAENRLIHRDATGRSTDWARSAPLSSGGLNETF